MKILTFQHKDILKEINSKGVYLSKRDSFYRSNTPKCYDFVFNSIKTKEPGSTQPIFGWHAVFNNEEITVNSKTIERCLEMTHLDENEYLLFELNIDDDKVSLQDFYNFVDARCEEEGIDPYYECFEDFPMESLFNFVNCEIQCTISSIRKEYIQNIYSYKNNNGKYIINTIDNV